MDQLVTNTINNCQLIPSEHIYKPKDSTPNELIVILNDILKQVTDKDNY